MKHKKKLQLAAVGLIAASFFLLQGFNGGGCQYQVGKTIDDTPPVLNAPLDRDDSKTSVEGTDSSFGDSF
ncbi:MAG: hypothetical protein Q8O95_01530 [bacterium]|nr:hypothetical protein [bacterium]